MSVGSKSLVGTLRSSAVGVDGLRIEAWGKGNRGQASFLDTINWGRLLIECTDREVKRKT